MDGFGKTRQREEKDKYDYQNAPERFRAAGAMSRLAILTGAGHRSIVSEAMHSPHKAFTAESPARLPAGR
jgi:hypothetical protein